MAIKQRVYKKHPWSQALSQAIERELKARGLRTKKEISDSLGIKPTDWTHISGGWHILSSRRENYAKLFAWGVPEADPTKIPAQGKIPLWTEKQLEDWLWENVPKMREVAPEFEKYREEKPQEQLSEYRQWASDRREEIRKWAISRNLPTLIEVARDLNLSANIWHSLMQGVVLNRGNRWVYAELMLHTGLATLNPATIPDRIRAMPTHKEKKTSREAWNDDDWERWLSTQPHQKRQRYLELTGKGRLPETPPNLSELIRSVKKPSGFDDLGGAFQTVREKPGLPIKTT